jgi:hypothetical protein
MFTESGKINNSTKYDVICQNIEKVIKTKSLTKN